MKVIKTEKNQLKFLSKKQAKLLEHIGARIIGVPIDQLGSDYLKEIDDYLDTLPKWVQKDFKLLFWSFNFPFTRFYFRLRFTSFTKMKPDQQTNYLKKWGSSRIPLMRSGFVGLKGVVSWGYYSQNKEFLEKIQYPGSTIGRENITPTFLFGKEPWKQIDS